MFKKGYKQTDLHKKRIGDSLRGRKCKPLSEEHRNKIGLSCTGRIGGNTGHKHSEETKAKISAGGKGRIVSEETRKKLQLANLGKKASLETRKNLSKSHIGLNIGNKNGSWIDGRSYEPYSSKFNNHLKQKIRERDNNICQLCNRTKKEEGENLSVHHIDYNKKNCDDNNLITLCKGCNTKVNTNRNYYKQLFQQKINVE